MQLGGRRQRARPAAVQGLDSIHHHQVLVDVPPDEALVLLRPLYKEGAGREGDAVYLHGGRVRPDEPGPLAAGGME